MDYIQFLEEFDCYKTRIFGRSWLSRYKTYRRRTATASAIESWGNNFSALLYSDLLVYNAITPSNVNPKIFDLINNDIVDKSRIVAHITKRDYWEDAVIDDDRFIINVKGGEWPIFYETGMTTAIMLVELNDDEFSILTDYFKTGFAEHGIKDTRIVQHAFMSEKNPALVIIPNGAVNPNGDQEEYENEKYNDDDDDDYWFERLRR